MKKFLPFSFHTVAVGGTFDHLHDGHIRIILEAFRVSERVLIGLTSDTYVREKFQIKLQIQKYQERKKELEHFLEINTLLQRAEIVQIEDIYGQADTDERIEAIVVTRETVKGAKLINKKRTLLGLKTLKIIQVPFVLTEDRKRISSTRIRLGEIDREGRDYKLQITNVLPRPRLPDGQGQAGKFQINSRFPPSLKLRRAGKISEKSRQKLKRPLGILIKGDPNNLLLISEKLKKVILETNPTMIITVGDEVTKTANQMGMYPELAIVDFKVGSKKKYESLEELAFVTVSIRTVLIEAVVTIRNPAGYISSRLVEEVHKAFRKIIESNNKRVIRVIGEEDLAGVPAILLAPLGSIVLYGQPNEGVVVVEVTEEKKKEVVDILSMN